jgi:hypothetical protein
VLIGDRGVDQSVLNIAMTEVRLHRTEVFRPRIIVGTAGMLQAEGMRRALSAGMLASAHCSFIIS